MRHTSLGNGTDAPTSTSTSGSAAAPSLSSSQRLPLPESELAQFEIQPSFSPSVLHVVSHTPSPTSPTPSVGSDGRRPSCSSDASGQLPLGNNHPRLSAREAIPAGEWTDWYAGGNWHPTIAPPVPAGLHDLVNNSELFPSSPLMDELGGPTFAPTSAPVDDAEQADQAPASATTSAVDQRLEFGSSLSILQSATPTDDSLSSLSSASMTNEAADILTFFRSQGYLPGPKGPFEAERLRILRRYDLDSPKRRAAVDQICRIAKAYFKTPTIIITLVFDGHTVFAAEAGFDPNGDPALDEPVRQQSIDTSLCAHAITRIKDRDIMIVPDVTKDWRFRNNPQSISQGGGLGFYAGATIHLPTNMETPEAPRTLPVGSICVISDEPRPDDSFTEEDQQVLRDLSSLVAEQFSLGYERLRRERERKQTEFLGSFLRTTLVQPLHPIERRRAEEASPIAPTTAASRTPLNHKDSSSLVGIFELAAQELLGLTGAASAAILDLRSFRIPHPQQSALYIDEDDDSLAALGSIFLLGSEGDVAWDEPMPNDKALAQAVVLAVGSWQRTGKCDYTGSELSPFAALFPDQVTATTFIPVAEVDGVISLMLILTSSSKHFVFEAADRKFACNVGSVLASALLRERALMADRAKLAFVSQVSHELRTPLFAVASQLELMREFSTPQELSKINPMLDVADVCLESLRDVLDDTLDVAKFSNSTSEIRANQSSVLAKTDLAQIAAEVSQACFIRKRRTDLVTKDHEKSGMGRRPSVTSTAVDLILEVEDRPSGWTAWIDVGGMKRVLLNLLGNSLKFTEEGHVKVSLKDLPALPSAASSSNPSSDGRTVVIIEVEDTGCGMSDEFLRSGSVFTPFIQEDPFRQGAGLGMSICETIVKRMSGKIDVVSALGQGTTVRVTLPLEFASLDIPAESPTTPRPSKMQSVERPQVTRFPANNPFAPQLTQASSKISPTIYSSARSAVDPFTSMTEDSGSRKTICRRVISDELLALFNPGTKLASTPYAERQSFDFSAAVDAAQVALGAPPLNRVPSSKRKTPALTKDEATSIDLVDEVAKLSISGVTQSSDRFGSPSWTNRPELVVETDGERLVSETTTTATAEIDSSPKLRVLFADDNAIARNILSKLLSGKGIAYVAAVDGEDAVQKFSSEGPFQLLLLDVQMPNKDGIEAAFDIRRIEHERGLAPSRIIALSGLSNEADMRKAGVLDSDGPIDHWVVKGNKSLRQVMNEVIAQREIVEQGAVLPESRPARLTSR